MDNDQKCGDRSAAIEITHNEKKTEARKHRRKNFEMDKKKKKKLSNSVLLVRVCVCEKPKQTKHKKSHEKSKTSKRDHRRRHENDVIAYMSHCRPTIYFCAKKKKGTRICVRRERSEHFFSFDFFDSVPKRFSTQE